MNQGQSIPQAGENLHGETMGTPQPEPGVQRAIEHTASQDADSPDTPEENLPPLEYSEQEPTAKAETVTAQAPTPSLERLPGAVSVSELAAQSQNKFGMGRS